MPKTPAFAVLRFDDHLTEVTSDINLLIKVVKVLLNSEAAHAEAERLNQLRDEVSSRYWVQATHLE